MGRGGGDYSILQAWGALTTGSSLHLTWSCLPLPHAHTGGPSGLSLHLLTLLEGQPCLSLVRSQSQVLHPRLFRLGISAGVPPVFRSQGHREAVFCFYHKGEAFIFTLKQELQVIYFEETYFALKKK